MAISSEYWAWDDPRLGGDTNKYGGPWDQVLKAAGFKGGPIDPITASMTNDRSGVYKAYLSGETMNENGGWDPRYELGYSPEAISAIDKFRASGYDLRIKNPDKRTFNTYWGFVTPEGVEDIKIAGSDLGEGLRAMTPFIALMAGPLGAQLGATVGGALGVTSAVGQQAIGSALVKAGLTAAQGGEFGDVLRSGATGLLSPYVPSVVKDVVPGSLGPLESAAEKAISSGVMSAISGKGDPGAAALGSLAGSAFGAVPGVSSLPPGLVQGALELASTGQLSLPTAFNAVIGSSQAYEAQKTQEQIDKAYSDPTSKLDVPQPSPNIRAELDSILGTPSDSSTLVAGPMDFSAPDRTAQKAQVADYIREQAASGARGFKVGSDGVLEVLDFDRGLTHRFTPDGSALGSLDSVFGPQTGSTPSAVKDFLAAPYVQSLFQGGTGAGGGAGNYLVPEVTGDGAIGGRQEAGSTYTDQTARELEEELAADKLMQVNPPVTLPVDEPVTLPTDAGTSGDYGQSVFDEIDRALAEDRRQREAQELQRQENERLEFEAQRQQEILREQERQDQEAARQEEERRVLREQAERDEALRAQQEVQRQEEEQARFEEQRAQEAAQQALESQRQEAEREQARIAEERQATERQQAEAARLADEQAAAQAQESEQRVDQGVPPVDAAQVDQGQAQEAVQAPVQQPAGVGLEQVRQIVSEALLVNPSLTEQQVLNIVTGVMDNLPAGLTSQDVADVVDAAIGRLPQGPTTADIDSAVNRAMADVATKADLSGYATSQDVSQLGQNLQGQVQHLNQDLQYAISDAIASGLQGDAALRAGLDTLAQNLGTTRDELLSSVGTTEQSLRADFSSQLGGVSAQIDDVQNLLLDKIAAAQSVGLQGDEALKAGLDSLAADLGMTQSSLLAQLGTTAEALRSDFASELGGVKTQVDLLNQDLQYAISDAIASGLRGDAALQEGLDSLASNLGTTREELISRLGTSAQALRTDFASQIGGVQTQVTQLGSSLYDAIEEARISGLQGDAALQAALDALADNFGVTKSEFLSQLGRTEDSLRSELGIQLGGVQTQVTQLGDDLRSAINQARADGFQGDAALQKGLDTLAGDLGTTKAALLSQLGQTTESLRSQFQADLGGLEAGLTGQIGQLREESQNQYNAMTAAQQAEVAERVRLGQDLTRAISDVQSVVTGEVEGVKSELTGQIGGLRQDVAEQFQTLSDAQQAEVQRRISQGENLEAAINAVSSGLGERLTGVETGLTQKIGGVEDRLNDRIGELVSQGVDFQTATNQALREVTGGLESLSQQQVEQAQTTQQAIGGVESRLTDRIDQLMQQGVDWQTAAEQAIAELSGSVTGLAEQTQSSISGLGLDIQSQIEEMQREQALADAAAQEMYTQEQERNRLANEAAVARAVAQAAQQAEQQRAAQAAQAAEASRRQGLMGLASSFAAQGAAQPAADAYKATFLKPYIVGGTAPEKFEGPLSGFLKQAMTGDFLPDKPQDQPRQSEDQQMGADQFFSGSNPLDMYQPEQEYQGLFGFRAGGMVPFMAQGGTRYGHNAHGALRVLEHSGKHRVDYRQGDAVTGIGDGQSDDIPAMLADGEFVIPADVVAALGNGSTKAGSDKLYEMMHNIRRHHRSTGPKDLPPPTKAPLEYIKSRKGRSA